MTAPEYIQLKAFARQDGFLLALLWTAAFACYIMGLTNEMMGMAAILLVLMSPFFVGQRLRKFRDEAREGFISFRRGYAYSVFVFFYGGVLLAVAQFVYFAFMDNGYLMSMISKAVTSEAGQQLIKEAGMTQTMDESLTMMASMRPIDYALNVLTIIIIFGFMLGIPIGLINQRSERTNKQVKE